MLHLINDPTTFTMMILFPFIITWVLGTALNQGFKNTYEMPQINVPVIASNGLMEDLYIKEGKNAGIIFERISKDDLQEKLDNNEVKKYVEIDNDKITMYSDVYSDLDSLILRIYSDSFAKQSNLVNEAVKSGKLSKAFAKPERNNYVDVENVSGSKSPGSIDYYAIAMITMTILYGAIQTAETINREKQENTILRLKSSPYSMNGVFFAKVFAASVVLIMQVIILMLSNILIYSANFGNAFISMLSLVPFALFSCGLGLLVYEASGENFQATNGTLNVLVILFTFLGGGYVPLNMLSNEITNISTYTPVGMMNQGLMRFIYSQDSSMLIRSVTINLILGAAFIALSFIMYTKKGGKR